MRSNLKDLFEAKLIWSVQSNIWQNFFCSNYSPGGDLSNLSQRESSIKTWCCEKYSLCTIFFSLWMCEKKYFCCSHFSSEGILNNSEQKTMGNFRFFISLVSGLTKSLVGCLRLSVLIHELHAQAHTRTRTHINNTHPHSHALSLSPTHSHIGTFCLSLTSFGVLLSDSL